MDVLDPKRAVWIELGFSVGGPDRRTDALVLVPGTDYCLASCSNRAPVHGSVRKATWVIRLGKGNYSAVNTPDVFC